MCCFHQLQCCHGTLGVADEVHLEQPPLGVGESLAQGCEGRAGTAALGLALLSLMLMVVLLAWVAMGASVTQWGPRGKPQSLQILSSFMHHPLQPLLTALPPLAKSAVDSSLCV